MNNVERYFVNKCDVVICRRAFSPSWSSSNWRQRRAVQFVVGRAQVWRRIRHHRLHRRDMPQRQLYRLDHRCPCWRQLLDGRLDRSVRERPLLRQSVLGEPSWRLQEAVWTQWTDITQTTTRLVDTVSRTLRVHHVHQSSVGARFLSLSLFMSTATSTSQKLTASIFPSSFPFFPSLSISRGSSPAPS